MDVTESTHGRRNGLTDGRMHKLTHSLVDGLSHGKCHGFKSKKSSTCRGAATCGMRQLLRHVRVADCLKQRDAGAPFFLLCSDENDKKDKIQTNEERMYSDEDRMHRAEERKYRTKEGM